MITIEEHEAECVIDALYDAEILARRKARERTADGTDDGRERALQWYEAARKYRKLRHALLQR